MREKVTEEADEERGRAHGELAHNGKPRMGRRCGWFGHGECGCTGLSEQAAVKFTFGGVVAEADGASSAGLAHNLGCDGIERFAVL